MKVGVTEVHIINPVAIRKHQNDISVYFFAQSNISYLKVCMNSMGNKRKVFYE